MSRIVNIKWSSELINSIARRRTVIVIGSGVSRNAINDEGKRPNSWEGFLKDCVSFCDSDFHTSINKMIEEKNYLMACELIKEGMGGYDFSEQIKKEYLSGGYLPADIHKYIYDLDLPIIITPNFDCIYDTYAKQISRGTILIKSYYDDDIPKCIRGNGDNRLIIKSHGSAESPDKVIFTNQDYVQARTKYSLFYEVIKSLVLTHTFLFIGCGIDDPDIKMIFEDIRFSHGDLLPSHYMTISSGGIDPKIKDIFQKMTNIRFLEYSGENNHQALTDSLRELNEQVENERSSLRESMKW